MTQAIDLKIVILGAANVGKTSINHRYCSHAFQPDTLSTVGAGFFTHCIEMEDKKITLLLWDTAGEERFRSVAPSLIRGSNGLILVYDVTIPSTFDELSLYYEMFLDTVSVDMNSDLPILLLGNKMDKDDMKVDKAEIEQWAKKNRIPHNYFVSAKTGLNVDEAMTALIKTLITPTKIPEIPTLHLIATPVEKSKCC